MTPPKPLPENARNVTQAAKDRVVRNNSRLFRAFIAAYRNDSTTALEGIADALEANAEAAELLVYLTANDIQAADNLIIDLERAQRQAVANGKAVAK